MAKIAALKINFAYNSVALEGNITSITQRIAVEGPVVTGLSDTGPRRVEGNYDYGYDLEGDWDGVSGGIDATLFGRIGNGGAATAFDPTGATAGANDPNFDSTSVLLETYEISGAVGGSVKFSAALQGNAALSRVIA